jgi:hypothetical protein
VRTSPRFGTGDQVFRNVRLSANTAVILGKTNVPIRLGDWQLLTGSALS